MARAPKAIPGNKPALQDAALLQAGAFLPASTALPASAPSDVVDARGYSHPALPGRVIVRLTPAPLAAADDAEMEVLGFSPPHVAKAVARTRRRALGFPGWPLVNDPKHARHALSVMKEFKVQAKLARTKPGHAKDGFDRMAEPLSRSVPHFLPSFYEEAGRAFLEAGNRTYASSAFAKAREAERVHALSIDLEARDRAFLEFALAGALSGKALGEHAQRLAESADAPVAYASFRELCVRRTLGGLPPWAGMGKDLRKLARKAGLDLDAEDTRLLREIIDSPAMAHAAGEFWTTYRPVLVKMGRESAAMRGALVRLMPEPAGDRAAFFTLWLGLLEESGAAAGLLEAKATQGAEMLPADGAAAWLSRLLKHCSGYQTRAPDAVFAFTRKMAPRLRAAAVPFPVGSGWAFDLDVLDLLCELQVPIAAPQERMWIRLEQWIKGSEGSKERPRDPKHIASEPRWRVCLEEAVGRAMSSPGFETAARPMSGLTGMRKSWLLRQLQLLAAGTLPQVAAALEALGCAVSAGTFAEFPEAWHALGKVDVSQALTRTLRAGVVDELGFPALEAAVEALTKVSTVLHAGRFPYLVLRAGLRAVVVGASGVLLEHELRVPAGARVQELIYAQGQLAVTYYANAETRTYWSGRPDEVFAGLESPSWIGERSVDIELEDGALFRGGRALHAGDKTTSSPDTVFSDGSTFWVLREGAPRELDPKTGGLGRKSLPRFFEEFAEEGSKLQFDQCSLHPLPLALREGTPLGSREGLSGLRVRKRTDGALDAEGIDGRRLRLAPRERDSLVGLVTLPGLTQPLAICTRFKDLWLEDETGRAIATLHPGGLREPYARGSPMVLPALFWHLLRVRDEAGSLALRSTTNEGARTFLTAAQADKTAAAGELPRTRVAVAGALAAVRDEGLLRGICGLASEAARLEAQLEQHRKAWEPSRAASAPAARLEDATIAAVLRPLVSSSGSSRDEEPLAAELLAVGEFLHLIDAEPKPLLQRALSAIGLAGASVAPQRITKSPPLGAFTWDNLIGATGAVAFLAASPLTLPAQRAALLAFLEAWAATPFAGTNRTLRRATAELPAGSDYAPVSNARSGLLIARGERRWFVRPRANWGDDRRFPILEAAPAGRFEPLPGATLSDERTLDDRPWSPERIRAFCQLLRERGPSPFSEEVVEELVRRTGLTRAEAALLWAGLPELEAYGHDSLGKERRAVLGLKVAEANMARGALKAMPQRVRAEVLAAAASGPLEALWSPLGSGPGDDGSPVARMAARLAEKMGPRATVDPALVLQCTRELPRGVEPAKFLSAIANCAGTQLWNRDGDFAMDEHGRLSWKPAPSSPGASEVFTASGLLATARYLALLFDALPLGDPLRAQLPQLLRLARQRLDHRGLLLDGGSSYVGMDKPAERAALLDAVGAEPYPAGGDPSAGRDGGVVIARASRWMVALAFRPALLAGAAGLEKLLRDSPAAAALRVLRSDGFTRLAARVEQTPVPDGAFEANPQLSVPELVAEVQKARKLSEDAAMLYLETLALRAPTARSVERWNGWTTGRYRNAAAELTDAKLLLEAKRARAGREHFLPGGWEDLPAPEYPLETWKLPLYEATSASKGKARPLGVLLPLRPLHELFEAAWARVKQGEAPGYEEV